jgi:transposase
MVVVKDHQQQEPSMGDITTIGLDPAKSVFQVHAVDEVGRIVLRKRLRRGQVLAFFARIPPCLIGLEACATAHHWARELSALGHEARLMPPNYLKAYVKRNKHDVADAEAICEVVRRPSMHFVPVKAVQQQSALMIHRARDLLIRQESETRPFGSHRPARTQLILQVIGGNDRRAIPTSQGSDKRRTSIGIL